VISYVVDASVALKWVFPEIYSDAARLLLQKNRELLAPDLIWAEVGNALWKKQRKGEIDGDAAQELLRDFRRFPIKIHPSETILDNAWSIAVDCDRSLYDCLYLALATSSACTLVTADRKLYNALNPGPLADFLTWVEDLQ
jgi:predicted nucleic acid-binding protein